MFALCNFMLSKYIKITLQVIFGKKHIVNYKWLNQNDNGVQILKK